MTPTKNIDERVKKAVARVFHRDISEITQDTHFVRDLFAKSVNIIELIAILEYEFGIEIPRAQSRKAETVRGTIELITSLVE